MGSYRKKKFGRFVFNPNNANVSTPFFVCHFAHLAFGDSAFSRFSGSDAYGIP
jgi:hypothetical protein